jgi:hypothetical protein
MGSVGGGSNGEARTRPSLSHLSHPSYIAWRVSCLVLI